MKTYSQYPSTKLSKPMKVLWKHYRNVISTHFNKSFSKQMEHFSIFIPIEPEYTIRFMSRIRKMLYKKVYGIGYVDIKHHIRPEEDKKLGILINYRTI